MNYGLENSNSNLIEQTFDVFENVSDNNLVETKEISEAFESEKSLE